MSRSRRPLVPDAELWRRVSEQVTPLKRRQPPSEKRATPKKPPEPPSPPAAAPPAAPPPPAPPPRPRKPTPPPVPGSGLDRRTAERFRRGELPLAGTLDLHGMTQAAAHAALEAFVHRGWSRGHRFVVIVTGKGRGEDDWGRPQRGVLRRMVPRWLAEPGLAPFVLATAPARPQHGGEGALYLLLRRKREG